MKTTTREHLRDELADVITARLLWALLPARHALGLQGQESLAEIVSWACNNIDQDVETILGKYEIAAKRSL